MTGLADAARAVAQELAENPVSSRSLIVQYLDEHAQGATRDVNAARELFGWMVTHRVRSPVFESAIDVVHEWESAHDTTLHKGTAYYFAGALALLHGALDRGFLYLHAALDEDLRTHGERGSGFAAWDEPAAAFVALRPGRSALAALTDRYANRAKRLLTTAAGGSLRVSLDLDSLRLRLQAAAGDGASQRREALFSFVHALARLDAIERTRDRLRGVLHTNAPFAAQLYQQIATSVCIATEQVLSASTVCMDKAADAYADAKKTRKRPNAHALGLNWKMDPLAVAITGQGLKDAPDGISDALESIEQLRPFYVARCVRNVTSHGDASDELVCERWPQIEAAVFGVFFAAVQHFAPQPATAPTASVRPLVVAGGWRTDADQIGLPCLPVHGEPTDRRR